MSIFYSYVSLPEGMYIYIYMHVFSLIAAWPETQEQLVKLLELHQQRMNSSERQAQHEKIMGHLPKVHTASEYMGVGQNWVPQ